MIPKRDGGAQLGQSSRRVEIAPRRSRARAGDVDEEETARGDTRNGTEEICRGIKQVASAVVLDAACKRRRIIVCRRALRRGWFVMIDASVVVMLGGQGEKKGDVSGRMTFVWWEERLGKGRERPPGENSFPIIRYTLGT